MPQQVTPIEYYSDPNNYGGYAFISLKDIVDGFLLAQQDDDSLIKNKKRSQIVKAVRDSIKSLYRETSNDTRKIEFTLPPSLVWPTPQDFVNWRRVSVAFPDSDGGWRLHELNCNDNISDATGYLQDHNFEILFDDEGYILTADSANAYNKPYKKYQFVKRGGMPRLDTSKLAEFGEFKVDQRRGYFIFDSSMSEKNIVIEYVTDGLEGDLSGESITVPKLIEDAVRTEAFFRLIEWSRNIPQNEKSRAKQRSDAEKHKAKMATSNINMGELSRVLRIKSMVM